MYNLVLVLFTIISCVSSTRITVSMSKDRLTKGESVEISWLVNIAKGEGILAMSIFVNGDNAPIASGSINGFSTFDHSEKYFGKRLEAKFKEDGSGKFYILKISNLTVDDSSTLTGELVIKRTSDDTTSTQTAMIVLDVTADGSDDDSTPLSDDPGMIAGIIIGVILFVILIIVVAVLVYRYKRKKETSSNLHKESMNLKSRDEPYEDYGHFSPSNNAVAPSAEDGKVPPTQIYAQLGTGGGRDGPRPEVTQSNYADVKTDALGYPASGPSANPSKPERGVKRSPNDDQSGIVV